MVKRFFPTLSEKWIKRQAHISVNDLEASVEHYLEPTTKTGSHFSGTRRPRTSLPQSLARRERWANDYSGTSETPDLAKNFNEIPMAINV